MCLLMGHNHGPGLRAFHHGPHDDPSRSEFSHFFHGPHSDSHHERHPDLHPDPHHAAPFEHPKKDRDDEHRYPMDGGDHFYDQHDFSGPHHSDPHHEKFGEDHDEEHHHPGDRGDHVHDFSGPHPDLHHGPFEHFDEDHDEDHHHPGGRVDHFHGQHDFDEHPHPPPPSFEDHHPHPEDGTDHQPLSQPLLAVEASKNEIKEVPVDDEMVEENKLVSREAEVEDDFETDNADEDDSGR